MPQYVYFLDLVDDPDEIAEYERWHEAVWPEVLEHLGNIGFQSCEIYRAANRLVMVVESENQIASDGGGNPLPERVTEWEALMNRFQVPLSIAEAGQKWVLGKSVFRFEK